MIPDISGHNVPQSVKVCLILEVFKAPVTPCYIFINSMKIESEAIQELLRKSILTNYSILYKSVFLTGVYTPPSDDAGEGQVETGAGIRRSGSTLSW